MPRGDTGKRRLPTATRVGNVIRTIREERKLSASAFGSLLGVSSSYIFDLERGARNVSVSTAMKWAPHIGYREEDLIEIVLQDQLDAMGLTHLSVEVMSLR